MSEFAQICQRNSTAELCCGRMLFTSMCHQRLLRSSELEVCLQNSGLSCVKGRLYLNNLQEQDIVMSLATPSLMVINQPCRSNHHLVCQ